MEASQKKVGYFLRFKMKINKIFIAGPLFTPKEREETQEITQVLENAGYETFLAQRDGLLFADIVKEIKDIPKEKAEEIVMKLIFHLDAYQASKVCDAIVFDMNGRVPDEGAVAETALGFAKGKPVILYKNDSRSLIQGHDNPLISGLSNFKIINNIKDIPVELKKLENIKESPYNKFLKKSEEIFGKGKKYTAKELSELAKKYFLNS